MNLRKNWIVFAVVLTLAGRAGASAVSLQFAGAVTNVPSGLSSQFTIGQQISGTFTFETSTADLQNSPQTGGYTGAISAFSSTIGSYALTSIFQGDIEVGNGSVDTYIATSFVQGNSVNGASPLLEAIQLSDATGTAWASDALPLTVDVSQFGVRDFTLDFSNGDRLVGQIQSIFVPEPAVSGWLALLMGLLRLPRCRGES